jgi:hypothetical protein
VYVVSIDDDILVVSAANMVLVVFVLVADVTEKASADVVN